MSFYILGLVTTFAVAYVKGQCQQPGNAKCYSVSAPVGPVGSSCCSGAQCQPWLADGETFTVPVDWYCLSTTPIALNGACDNKVGKCATGLSCTNGVCTDPTATTAAVTTPAVTTAAVTTAAVTSPGQCQQPGNAKCYSVSAPVGPVGSSCCSGAQCQPWLADGETFTVPVDWYCLSTTPIALNGACDNKVGKCDTGLNCIAGVCSDQAVTTTTTTTTTSTTTTTTSTSTSTTSTSTTTTSSSTTTTSTSTTTTSTSTTTTSTTTSTTAEDCDKQGGELCLDTKYNIQGTCCSPFTCTKQTERSSLCKGENLAAGDACFSATSGSLGSCADPLICLDDVCTKPDATCIDPVNGLCYSSDVHQSVGTCCAGSNCWPVTDATDFFCQAFLPIGGNCNETEHRGFCNAGFCVGGICKEGTATTTTSTTTSTTSTTTTTTTTTIACIASGAVCLNFGDANVGGTCCGGTGDCNVVDPTLPGYNCK